ncbi:MAG: hypothetical protein VXX57_03035 [Cyanobacteriota bacterium]|nr:hypothetical protein [Cyanobacteriota bacterium]
MATILLNGVETDASSITGSELADKLTVSGGDDGLEVQMSGGDDAVEIYADSENISDSVIRMGEGDDIITAVAASGVDADGPASEFNGTPVSLGESLIGGPGEDTIDLGDGLVSLTGTIKGNEDDDTITLAHATGGTVQGNSGDDTITIGLTSAIEAGSRAEISLTDASINGSSGDDLLIVANDAALNDSSIRGNEGDDTITIGEAEATGSVSIEGNGGNDLIDAAALEGSATVRGGQGDDTLIVGNGQTVFGGLGADTFRINASGGAVIEDYDRLDADCFCDDTIEIGNINFDTATYGVERVKYTSASSWTGDIKVKAVAGGDADDATAIAKLTATKTETLSAFAVARLYASNTTTATGTKLAKALTRSTPTVGLNSAGETFENGLGTAGIGQVFVQAEGLFTSRVVGTGGVSVAGQIRNVIASTYTQYEKGDFSFLQLTAKDTAGITVGQKLVYSDITNATIKNHWASYNKTKNTGTADLRSLQFGTAQFTTITTGKAFMVVTDVPDQVFKTETLESNVNGVTATVTLDLDDVFSGWRRNFNSTGSRTEGTTFNNDSKLAVVNTNTNTNTNLTGFAYRFTTTGGGKKATVFAPSISTSGLIPASFFTANASITGVGALTLGPSAKNTTTTSKTTSVTGSTGKWDRIFGLTAGTTTGGSILTGWDAANRTATGSATAFTGRFLTAGGDLVFNTGAVPSNAAGTAKVDFTTLTGSQLYWSTVQRQGQLTLTTTAFNTVNATPATTVLTGTSGLNTITAKAGLANTNVTRDDFETVTGRLAVKIRVAETATATVSDAVGTLVARTTITGQALDVTSCPDFPATTSLASQIVANNNQAKQGMVTGDFNTNLVWSTVASNILGGVVTNGTQFEARLNSNVAALGAGNGFFSASTFTVDALAAEGFGENAGDAQGAPFRVLFFDNDATDNGLYVVSGTANYNNSELTAFNTNPTGSSAMGGKHTIVKVMGDKGHPIELSDINLV